MYESADQAERDSTSPMQRTSVGASPSTSTEKRVADSPQPTTTSHELVTHSKAAQPVELLTQRLPRRSAATSSRVNRQRLDLNNHFSFELVWIARYIVIVRIT